VETLIVGHKPRFETEPQIPSVEREPEYSKLVAIFTSPTPGAPMIQHARILAIPGVGLVGDRYAERIGTYSVTRKRKKARVMPDNDHQVSIISFSGIDQANAILLQLGVDPFKPSETRRNLLVSLSPDVLNRLINKQFKIGSVLFEGVGICDPCTRPAELLGRSPSDAESFKTAFEGKGGIRAKIINAGSISIGNTIIPMQRLRRR